MKTTSIYIAFLLLLLSCASSKVTKDSIPINGVVISDMNFSPETINVKHGTTVTWYNLENKTHNAKANDDSWDTGDIMLGGSKSITFDKPGTYKYHCSHHTVLGIGMTGTVIVE